MTFIFALISIWSSDLQVFIQGALSMTILLNAPFLYRKINTYQALREISCLSDGCWALQDLDGHTSIYTLKASSTVLGSFFFLHFKNTVGTLNVVLAADSISKDDARRLRLTLNVYSKELMKASV